MVPRHIYKIIFVSATCVVAGCGSPQDPDPTPTSPPAPIPPGSYTIIDLRQSIDILRTKKQFGVFRNEEDPKIQWIEEADTQVQLADGKSTNALKLHYEVPTSGTYNGWWMKLNDADWSEHENSNLVLRLRLGPGCTDVFKLELKTNPGQMIHAAYVRIDDAQKATMEETGFCDVEVSIKDMVFDAANLSKMHELVIVFENTRIEKDRQKGDLIIHSIRLSPGADGADEG